jgi:hypothetical protein
MPFLPRKYRNKNWIKMSEKISLNFSIAQVYEALLVTRYACSSLARLTNGTTNFVFRGQLARPIVKDNERGNPAIVTTVIVKHTAAHAALNSDFPIDASRAVCTLLPWFFTFALSYIRGGEKSGVVAHVGRRGMRRKGRGDPGYKLTDPCI